MSKAVLVLNEMPKNCIDCPFNEYGIGHCQLYPRNPTNETQRPSWCPLRELPEKLSMDDYDEHVPENCEKLLEYYNDGFNDCLNQILGTEERNEI